MHTMWKKVPTKKKALDEQRKKKPNAKNGVVMREWDNVKKKCLQIRNKFYYTPAIVTSSNKSFLIQSKPWPAKALFNFPSLSHDWNKMLFFHSAIFTIPVCWFLARAFDTKHFVIGLKLAGSFVDCFVGTRDAHRFCCESNSIRSTECCGVWDMNHCKVVQVWYLFMCISNDVQWTM